MPFSDTTVTPEQNRTLSISIGRDPIHIVQYLHWETHHHTAAKCSVVNTFAQKATAVCSILELLRTEQQHVGDVLNKCKYTSWVLDRMKKELLTEQDQQNKMQNQPIKPRGILSYYTCKGCVKVLRTSVVSRIQPHLRATEHSSTSL